MPHIDFMALTAAYNREPYLTLVLVTATQGDLAVDDTSVGLGPSTSADADCSSVVADRPINYTLVSRASGRCCEGDG
jgi:hypothetical protein